MSNELVRDRAIIGALGRTRLPFDIRASIYRRLGMLGSQRVAAGRRVHRRRMRDVSQVVRFVGRNQATRNQHFRNHQQTNRLRSVQVAAPGGGAPWRRFKRYVKSRSKARYPRNKWRRR